MSNRELFPLDSEQPVKKDIGKIVMVYFRPWPLFITSIILAMLITFLYVRFFSIPKYSISSTIFIKEASPIPNLSNIATFGNSQQIQPVNTIANVVLLLKSRDLLRRTISSLTLTTTYYVNDKEVYGKDVPIKAVASKLDSTVFDQPFTIKVKPGNVFTFTDNTGQTITSKFGQEIQKPYGVFTIVATSALSDSFSYSSYERNGA